MKNKSLGEEWVELLVRVYGCGCLWELLSHTSGVAALKVVIVEMSEKLKKIPFTC